MDFIFDGQKIETLGQLLDAAIKAARDGKAMEFFVAYSRITPHAAENLGYGFGYFDDATRKEMYEAYRLNHPIFGGI